MRLAVLLIAWLAAPAAWAAHAYAQFGDIKYPKGFANFEWVNPGAPKAGDLSLVPPLRITNLDKLNPFTLKGTSPPGMGGLVIETLLTGRWMSQRPTMGCSRKTSRSRRTRCPSAVA